MTLSARAQGRNARTQRPGALGAVGGAGMLTQDRERIPVSCLGDGAGNVGKGTVKHGAGASEMAGRSG